LRAPPKCAAIKLILDYLLLLMRRVEKHVYDSHRLRDELLSLRLILRIGKFRAIEKRSRFSNARFETGPVFLDIKLVTSILNDFAGHNASIILLPTYSEPGQEAINSN
jgi:hypothetical protein